MKKTLRDQLAAASKKYAAKEAAGDERVEAAVVYGAKWWSSHSRKAVAEYEKELTDALLDRNGVVSLWEKLQIKKTARLWMNRDRLADELDMEPTLMRFSQGSTRQIKEDVDPRLTLLEKFDRTLTADLTAIGLNYNATPSKMVEPTKKGGDAMSRLEKSLSRLGEM